MGHANRRQGSLTFNNTEQLISYPKAGGGDRNIGVILRRPSLVLVSICLLGVYNKYNIHCR